MSTSTRDLTCPPPPANGSHGADGGSVPTSGAAPGTGGLRRKRKARFRRGEGGDSRGHQSASAGHYSSGGGLSGGGGIGSGGTAEWKGSADGQQCEWGRREDLVGNIEMLELVVVDQVLFVHLDCFILFLSMCSLV